MKSSIYRNQFLAVALILMTGAPASLSGQTEAKKGTRQEQAQAGKTPAAYGAIFRGAPDLVGAIQITHNISPDKRAATVIFRNLDVSISDVPPPPSGTPPSVDAARLAGMRHVDVRTATVALPIEAEGKEVRLRQDVRGHVDVSDFAQAVLVVRAAGKTTTVNLKKAAGKDGDYRTRIEATVPSGAIYQVTFVLLVERAAGDPLRGAQLSVESLDVELTAP